eukprot:8407447-Ditylum_brightwellii.AAC.3
MGWRIWKIFMIITSSSDDLANRKHPGGTCIGIINNTVGRKCTPGEDKNGLGQWSYHTNPVYSPTQVMRLSQHNRNVYSPHRATLRQALGRHGIKICCSRWSNGVRMGAKYF